MKTRLIAISVAALLSAWNAPAATTNELSSLLQRGLFEEEANRNFEAAITSYRSVAAEFDKHRQVAATAVFRLGECYRKLGRTNDAVAQYQRVVKEFSDQGTLAGLSRQNLAGLSVPVESSSPSQLPQSAREEQKKLLQRQIELAEQDMADAQKGFETGRTPQSEVRAAEMIVLRLRQQLAALNAAEPVDISNAAANTTGITDEEEKEIRRIQAMVRTSPDLINAPSTGNDRSTPLYRAAAAGQLIVARYLLDNGADANKAVITYTSTSERTPLHVAAENGHKGMVELLLNRGANVDPQDKDGRTPLHLAANKGFKAVVETLLDHKADLKVGDNGGLTPLVYSVWGRDLSTIQLMLQRGADVNAKSKTGNTVLMYATGDILKLFLTAKADPNITNSEQRTVISYAANSGEADKVRTLIAGGATANVVDKFGNTPLWLAIGGLNRDEVRQSPEKSADLIDVIRQLLEARADPNIVVSMKTPLHLAVERTNATVVELLLQHGANPNSASSKFYTQGAPREKWTPLHIAAYFQVTNVVAPLIKAGADPAAQDGEGRTPLHYAAGTPDILKPMVAGRVNVNVANNAGDTPLHWAACASAGPETAAVLLEKGADVNAQNKLGLTPLHLATVRALEPMVQLLLTNKADPNIRDQAGRTPLDFATRQMSYSTSILAPGVAMPSASPVSFPPPPSIRTFSSTVGSAVGGSVGTPSPVVTLLRQFGASDDLPKPDRIEVRRSSSGFSRAVFYKGPNDWNQFTLLEVIRNLYQLVSLEEMPFPDLSRVTVVSRGQNGAAVRKEINLFNGPNRIDCSRDVPVNFGDVVEIPERVHTLDQSKVGLTSEEINALRDCLKEGWVTFLTGNTQYDRPRLSIWHTHDSARIGSVLGREDARRILLSTSDLTKVKVTRKDPATGKDQQWILDCSNPSNLPDLWLRDGDVIEVPQR